MAAVELEKGRKRWRWALSIVRSSCVIESSKVGDRSWEWKFRLSPLRQSNILSQFGPDTGVCGKKNKKEKKKKRKAWEREREFFISLHTSNVSVQTYQEAVQSWRNWISIYLCRHYHRNSRKPFFNDFYVFRSWILAQIRLDTRLDMPPGKIIRRRCPQVSGNSRACCRLTGTLNSLGSSHRFIYNL